MIINKEDLLKHIRYSGKYNHPCPKWVELQIEAFPADQYMPTVYSVLFSISQRLIDVSKEHMTADQGIQEIRNELSKLDFAKIREEFGL